MEDPAEKIVTKSPLFKVVVIFFLFCIASFVILAHFTLPDSSTTNNIIPPEKIKRVLDGNIPIKIVEENVIDNSNEEADENENENIDRIPNEELDDQPVEIPKNEILEEENEAYEDNDPDSLAVKNDIPDKIENSGDVYKVKIPHVVGYDPVGEDPEIKRKRNAIKEGFRHAYKGYEDRCFGKGELKPVSGNCHPGIIGGLGLSIIDSMDTMLIMGLDEEYKRARDYVVDMDFSKNSFISVFETNIRVVGGLLTAYEFTGDQKLLDKCQEVTDKLLPAFNTPTGIPKAAVNLNTGKSKPPGWTGGASILSEVGTLQLEFSTLSHHTNDPKYAEKALGVFDTLKRMQPSDGLYPVFMKTDKEQFTKTFVSVGALGDSFYEYILKMWLLTGDEKYKNWYYEEAEYLINGLGRELDGDKYYFAEKEQGTLKHKFDHLACFIGGMYALGAQYNPSVKEQHMKVAEGVGNFCYEMYKINPTGLPCEFLRVNGGKLSTPVGQGEIAYLMRPEAIEAWFVLWRTTKDPIWREYGWKAFEAMEKVSRSTYGYSGLRDARKAQPDKDDVQQSYYLAESMKYLYLLFAPDDVIPLDEFVFNTEAHPLRVRR
eukprot:TRINITY_DN2267_c0_g1_i1.p1 TRINITY_DN2267_c0_g1~~TRINITY_DN2267_c0_g1_i1.p1  ORF type:complete len:601 (+),score=157.02 TRINITY_DN2267_c0_g1_i1:39-1841(+)